MNLVTIEEKDRIAFLTMRNTKRLNCLSRELCEDLIEAILLAYKKENMAIVVRAEPGVKVWSAGHDIKELPLDKSDPLSFEVPMERLLRIVQNMPIPVIALIEGTVWGGACDFSLACDMIIASETSTFAITPAKIGIPYNASGIMHFINQLGINKAREMFFTAAPIEAKDALNVGLINHIAPADKLEEVLEEKILAPIRRNSLLSISAIKRQFRLLSSSMSQLDAESFERLNAWRSEVYRSNDYKEGVESFKQKRTPEFKGKAKSLDIAKDFFDIPNR